MIGGSVVTQTMEYPHIKNPSRKGIYMGKNLYGEYLDTVKK